MSKQQKIAEAATRYQVQEQQGYHNCKSIFYTFNNSSRRTNPKDFQDNISCKNQLLITRPSYNLRNWVKAEADDDDRRIGCNQYRNLFSVLSKVLQPVQKKRRRRFSIKANACSASSQNKNGETSVTSQGRQEKSSDVNSRHQQ